MKTFHVVVIVLVAFAVLAIGIAAVAIGSYNELNTEEQGVQAAWRDSQVQYDKFWKTVKETAQVTDKYAADFKETFLGSIEGRYDPERPVQFLMEANPGLPPDTYLTLQHVIEAGRGDFAQTQRTLIDSQRRYATSLRSFPTVLMAHSFGYPSEITGEYAPQDDIDGDGKKTVLDYRSVTSERTQKVFATGREDSELDVFEKPAPKPAPAPEAP